METKVQRPNLRNLKAVLLCVFALFFIAGCGKNGASNDTGLLSLGGDDTEQAVKYVDEANDDLKRIKILYRENNQKRAELKTALTNNDIEKVKRLSDDLLLVILDGFAFAESAKDKIGKALALDINDDFKHYLRLKDESLSKQVKAFDYWKDSAKLFRDKFDASNPASMTEAATKFKENEKNFEKTMEEAKKLSEEADKFYKEVENKDKN